MIKIYNPKGDSVGIIEPNMPVIEREMNLPPTLLFDVDFESSKLIQLEGLAKTEVGDYIVKEKKKNNMGYSVVCKPDFTSLQSELISYEFKTVTAEKMIGDILGANSGWTYNVSGSEKRSLKIDERNKYDSIFAVADTFRYEIFFDIESKKITMRNNIGDNSGKLYIHDEVNLINLVSTSDSYDVYTRIIPRGKDGLDIASINGGKTYIDNFQYSNKVKPLIWEDERYTVAENLKEDAIKKLLDLSKPHQSFEIDIVNLYKLDNEKWEFLKLEVGDFVDLVSSSDGVDVKQRIVKKISELGGDGTGDKIVIANLSRNFVDENSDDSKLLREAMELVDEVIRDTGEYLENDFNDKFKAIGDMIKGENGGYKIDRYNELGQAYETLYLDNTDIDKAVNVIRLNNSGIAFSTNGIDGPYNIAMTIDGAIAASGAVIRNLESVSITGDVINIMSSSTTFDVGTGTEYYADFSQVLNAIGNRKHLANGVKLTINIRSVLTETISIEGFSGGGEIELNIYSRVNGNIETKSNSCLVRVHGRNTTHVINGSSYPIISSADSYAYFGGLNIDANNSASGKGITSQRGSNVYVEDCDIVNVQDALYALSDGSLQALDTKGNPTRHSALGSSGVIRLRGMIADGTTFGFVESFGEIPRTPSSFSPSPTTTDTETRTFNHTDIYTYSVKYGARSAHYGKAGAQNRWDSTMTQMKGRISFGSSVYSFINGRDSGTTPTVKIRLRRQSSAHGTSSSVKPTPEWSGAPSFGGATRGNWTPWVTIPYTLFTSSGYTFSFYNGTTGNSYAIWDRAEVQITRTVTQ